MVRPRASTGSHLILQAELHFHCAFEFGTLTLASMLDSSVRVTTGCLRPFRQDRLLYETSVGRTTARAHYNSPKDYLCARRFSRLQPILTCIQLRRKECNTELKHFPFSNFRYFLTLFSKFFASFLHSTCSLSVSHLYLALDGIYHPI